MRSLIVENKYDCKKLNNFLWEHFPNLTLNSIHKALRKKDIMIDGKRISKNVTVKAGSEIKVYIVDPILLGETPKLDIVYEDDMIVILNKPIGIEVLGENGLTDIVQKTYQIGSDFPSPCHRLDRNTSGLILFAKNQECLNVLLHKFKNREIEKHYQCDIYGIPSKKKDTLHAYLFKDSKKSMVYISDTPKKGYQEIITSYSIIKEDKNSNICTLDVQIQTGRTHQIRAHLAHIGYPIIGDGKYGKNEINKKFNAKTQVLHSSQLKFNFTSESGILEYLNGKEVII